VSVSSDATVRSYVIVAVAGPSVGGWAREEHPGVTEIVLAGLSLSGLAAAYAATRHPAVFRAAVCQSPAFWWERGRFAEELHTRARPVSAEAAGSPALVRRGPRGAA
jgi:pimeloyl-ACP methyl ester carboxylesterase